MKDQPAEPGTTAPEYAALDRYIATASDGVLVEMLSSWHERERRLLREAAQAHDTDPANAKFLIELSTVAKQGAARVREEFNRRRSKAA